MSAVSRFAAALVGFASLVGCGAKDDSPVRRDMNGAVSLDGKPLEEGEIRFVPTEGTAAPVSGGPIASGRYDLTGKAAVPVGTHRVEITAYRTPDGAVVPRNAGPGTPWNQIIPAEYNTASTLKVKVEAGAAPLVKDFELSDKRP